MDRNQRWGNKAQQRQERTLAKKRPQHARVSLRVLQCIDCESVLSAAHPHGLLNRCRSCWQALQMGEEAGAYV